MMSRDCSESDRIFLSAAIHTLQPLDTLSPGRREELAGLCAVERCALGQDPFRLRGTQGQMVYLLSGELKLAHGDGSMNVIVGGSEAARRPLCQPVCPQRSDLCGGKAITDVTLLRIDADALDIMMTWDQLSAASPPPDGEADHPDWRLMSGAFRLESLTQGALSPLPAACIDALLRRFERIRVDAGEVIVREGDEGDFYYIIESGACQVTRRVGGVDMSLADLKPGDAFGEEALVADARRNATVRMRRAGVLLRLGKSDFIELLREPLLKRLPWREARHEVETAGAVWLDVRYPSEYQVDRLPGALNVPLGEIRNAIGVLDRSREYIVYCQSGRRSSAAAFLLSQHGYRAGCLESGLRAIAHESLS